MKLKIQLILWYDKITHCNVVFDIISMLILRVTPCDRFEVFWILARRCFRIRNIITILSTCGLGGYLCTERSETSVSRNRWCIQRERKCDFRNSFGLYRCGFVVVNTMNVYYVCTRVLAFLFLIDRVETVMNVAQSRRYSKRARRSTTWNRNDVRITSRDERLSTTQCYGDVTVNHRPVVCKSRT